MMSHQTRVSSLVSLLRDNSNTFYRREKSKKRNDHMKMTTTLSTTNTTVRRMNNNNASARKVLKRQPSLYCCCTIEEEKNKTKPSSTSSSSRRRSLRTTKENNENEKFRFTTKTAVCFAASLTVATSTMTMPIAGNADIFSAHADEQVEKCTKTVRWFLSSQSRRRSRAICIFIYFFLFSFFVGVPYHSPLSLSSSPNQLIVILIENSASKRVQISRQNLTTIATRRARTSVKR